MAAEAQSALTKSDSQGPVSVTVTLTAPPAVGTPITLRVALNTHSVGLDGIAFDSAVVLRKPDGTEVAPTVERTEGGGHHRQAVLVFPAPAAPGPVRIVVKDVDGMAERVFTWEVR